GLVQPVTHTLGPARVHHRIDQYDDDLADLVAWAQRLVAHGLLSSEAQNSSHSARALSTCAFSRSAWACCRFCSGVSIPAASRIDRTAGSRTLRWRSLTASHCSVVFRCASLFSRLPRRMQQASRVSSSRSRSARLVCTLNLRGG